MQIDLAQILTNIIGFLLVVWLLRKFAWGPILGLLDARREKIRGDFAEAEKALRDAEVLKGEFAQQLGNIKSIERERIQEAVKRGEGIADSLVDEARHQADAVRQKAQTDIAVEVEKARLQLRDAVVSMAISASEKVIGETLDDERHRRLIGEFIDGLEKVPHA